jgi:xylulokinase
MKTFLGIDSSTTATKALLMDERGKVLGVASSEYGFDTPHPLWSEQDPALWWDATIKSIRAVISSSGVDANSVQGIGLTGQMHGLVLLDENGTVLRPAILWNDQRTAQQCDTIRARLGRERLIQITGNDALTGFTAPKIVWVQENEPELWKRTRHILLPKDYVRLKMTDGYAMDKADGAGTILFDLKARTWSAEVLAALNIPAEYMPVTVEGPEISGTLSAGAASLLGLPAGIPVVGGGGDQAASAVGTGAVVEGIVSLSLGTSGVVFATMNTPAIEPQGRLHAFCHSVPGKWHFMGVMLSAAGSLRWYRDTFAPGMGYDELLAPCGAVAAGCDGLLFLPYLTGERTPYPDPLARGAFSGLTVRHSFAHLTRAVIEGVSFGLRDSFELLKSAGLHDITQVRVTGGGVKSYLWRQILADVFNVEIVTVNTTEGAAYGASLLAATGAGVFSDIESACNATIHVLESTSPGPAREVYENQYPFYRGLYPALSPTFHALN